MDPTQQTLEKIRGFNRYYTNVIGLLDRHYLNSPFSLTESRVLYEIMHSDPCTAKNIREKIQIDEGYLSRILDKFIQAGLITKAPSPEDRRLHLIGLTGKGIEAFAALNDNSDRLIGQIIDGLSESQRNELTLMMERIQLLLDQNQTQ
jgi:DNA-binding MarR family transcriptional regulator